MMYSYENDGYIIFYLLHGNVVTIVSCGKIEDIVQLRIEAEEGLRVYDPTKSVPYEKLCRKEQLPSRGYPQGQEESIQG